MKKAAFFKPSHKLSVPFRFSPFLLFPSVLSVLSVLSVSPARAGDSFSSFQDITSGATLKPFARDLGGLLGSDSFHSARVLGFSGFDLGFQTAVQFAPDKNDAVLGGPKNGASALWLPFAQAEIGMPLRFDAFVRGTSAYGMTVAGGGLRYGILEGSDKPWTPRLIAVLMGNAATDPYYSAVHYGGNIAFSMGKRSFSPYAGVGFDATDLTVGSVADSALDGSSVSVFEPRFTVGAQFVLKALLYAHVAYLSMHGQNGMQGGVGVRF